MINAKMLGMLAAAFVAGSFFASPELRAYASTIANDVICTGCVGTADLAGNAVTSAKIKDGEVKSEDIALSAIGSARIKDNDVKAQDIAPSAVGTSEIADGAITYGDVSRSFVAVEHRNDCNCGGTGWDPDGSLNIETLYDNRITSNSVVSVTGVWPYFDIICWTNLPDGFYDRVYVTCNKNIPNGFAINYAIFNNPAYGEG